MQANLFNDAKGSTKPPDVFSKVDLSHESPAFTQCVFQYALFYGAFWFAMVVMMILVPGQKTERAVCVLIFVHIGLYSEATWYQQ